MKLRINGFENDFILKKDAVNILKIDNVKCFAHILETFNDKVNGFESNEIFLLDEDNNEINIAKDVYFCSDIFNLDYNSKKILTKLYKILSDKIQLNQDFFIDSIVLKLRNYIITEVNELPFEFTMKSGIDIIDILKLFDIKIDNTSCENIINRLEILIDLIATLKITKLLVVHNLRMYLSTEDLLELYKYSVYNDVNLLSIERVSDFEKLKYENVLYIDKSFNDFVL